jgi:hypothetical protein
MGKSTPKKRILWSEDMEEALLREVRSMEPYSAPYGTVGVIWEDIASALQCHDASITARIVQHHFDQLLKAFRKADRKNRGATGISEAVTTVTALLSDIDAAVTTVKEEKASIKMKETDKALVLKRKGELLCAAAEERVAKRQKTEV